MVDLYARIRVCFDCYTMRNSSGYCPACGGSVYYYFDLDKLEESERSKVRTMLKYLPSNKDKIIYVLETHTQLYRKKGLRLFTSMNDIWSQTQIKRIIGNR